MSFNYKINAKTWEGLAQEDALWAILTDQDKQGGKWDLNTFFEAGEKEINTVFAYLQENNFLPTSYKNAIDFGCGVGRLTRFIAPHFAHTTGIDVAQTMIAQAQKLNADLGESIDFKLNLAPNLAIFPNNSLSFIYSSIVLQHIPRQEGMLFIEQFLQKLSAGGVAVFQVPTRDIRNIGFLQKIRETLKIRQKLAVLGLLKGYQMEMNVYNPQVIEALAQKYACEVLACPFTNHTLKAFNGNLQFLQAHECTDYESKMFVVRKQQAV